MGLGSILLATDTMLTNEHAQRLAVRYTGQHMESEADSRIETIRVREAKWPVLPTVRGSSASSSRAGFLLPGHDANCAPPNLRKVGRPRTFLTCEATTTHLQQREWQERPASGSSTRFCPAGHLRFSRRRRFHFHSLRHILDLQKPRLYGSYFGPVHLALVSKMSHRAHSSRFATLAAVTTGAASKVLCSRPLLSMVVSHAGAASINLSPPTSRAFTEGLREEYCRGPHTPCGTLWQAQRGKCTYVSSQDCQTSRSPTWCPLIQME